MFILSAEICGDGLDPAVVCCFDPTMVIARLRAAIPEVEVVPQDFAWRDYDAFKRHDVVESAVSSAQRDAWRRGPIWTFRLPAPDGPEMRGRAERYDVTIFCESPIPEPLKSRFLAFLEGLRFAPCVRVKAVRLEDNDEFPA